MTGKPKRPNRHLSVFLLKTEVLRVADALAAKPGLKTKEVELGHGVGYGVVLDEDLPEDGRRDGEAGPWVPGVGRFCPTHAPHQPVKSARIEPTPAH